MRVVVYLPNGVPVFRASAPQVSRLSQRMPGHALLHVESQAEFLKALPEADVAVVWKFAADWYASAPRLRHVCTPAAGREWIEPDPGGQCTLHFGTFHGEIMAESLLGMLLFMARRFGDALAAQRAHRWDRTPFQYTEPVAGQTVLILGYGTIGAHLARVLRGFGLIVHGLKRDTSRGGLGLDRLFSADQLHMSLSLADHVVCVLPGGHRQRSLAQPSSLQSHEADRLCV